MNDGQLELEKTAKAYVEHMAACEATWSRFIDAVKGLPSFNAPQSRSSFGDSFAFMGRSYSVTTTYDPEKREVRITAYTRTMKHREDLAEVGAVRMDRLGNFVDGQKEQYKLSVEQHWHIILKKLLNLKIPGPETV